MENLNEFDIVLKTLNDSFDKVIHFHNISPEQQLGLRSFFERVSSHENLFKSIPLVIAPFKAKNVSSLSSNINNLKFPTEFKTPQEIYDCLIKCCIELSIPVYATSKDNIVLKEKICDGTLGEVRKAILEKEEFVIKLIDLNGDLSYNDTEMTIKNILSELLIMSSIQHPKIPKFYGLFQDDKGDKMIGLIFQNIEGITLKDYVLGTNETKTKPTDKELFNLMNQLVEAIIFLHEKNLVHRDLHPEKVLVTSDGTVYLTGFGMAMINHIILSFNLKDHLHRHEFHYYPPEGCKDVYDEDDDYDINKFKITAKYDVWSLGCIMIFMFSPNHTPWVKYKDSNKMVTALKRMPERVYQKFDENHKAYELIKMCCKSQADDRCTSSELLEKLKAIK